MTVDPKQMKAVRNALAAIVDEATFDLDRTRITADGRHRRPTTKSVSAAELREIYFREEEQVIEKRVELRAPEALRLQLVDALGLVLGQFIDPETDRIGHAFPIEQGTCTRHTLQEGGYSDMDFESSPRGFADGLVQAAAIVGMEKTMRLLTEWAWGEPVRYRVCTVLNGMPLSAAVKTGEGIRLVPLALTTTRLPRVPIAGDVLPRSYLGHTLLSREMSASPALFRPEADKGEQTVSSRPVDGSDFDFVCQALSLQGNCHVSWSIVWNDYLDATPLCLRIRDPWWRSEYRVEPLRSKRETHRTETGEVEIKLSDEVAAHCLDGEELNRTLQGLHGADKKLRIAIDRWRRSKLSDGHVRLEDRYIDLRIALELLFLKDFRNGRDQEMSFRMSLVGAWYLAECPGERRAIRKALKDAYSTASKAVHLGEVQESNREKLSVGQDLCRQGILKLLHEGPPSDWGDLVLGVGSL